MKRAIKNPTKAEAAYQAAMRAQGCAVCDFRIKAGLQPERYGQCGSTHLHHRNLDDKHGQLQIGQHAVVGLGAWHHDGVIGENPLITTGREMERVFGLSFKSHARRFSLWTDEVLPGMGRGTEAWQRYQEGLLPDDAPRMLITEPDGSISRITVPVSS